MVLLLPVSPTPIAYTSPGLTEIIATTLPPKPP